jgi:hypothetical protein
MNTSVSNKAGSLVFAFCLIAVVGGKHEVVAPPQVPDILKAPKGQVILLKAHGRGVQIYTCKARANDPNSFAWSFNAPEADLIDERGNKIGRHYAGPTWEAGDGSRVTGEVQQKADAPKAGAIPWLLLKAKSHEGAGTLGRVLSIQRVNTEGGVAPVAGCGQAHLNNEVRVDYRADYYFYVSGR